MTRVLLYTPEPVLGQGFLFLLAGNSNFAPSGVSTSADTLCAALEKENPDVLLLDFTSDVNFRLLRDLKKSCATCKILLWVSAISTELAFQAISLGVRGIIMKTLPAETLIDCLARIQRGETWFEKSLTDKMLIARKVLLTRREGQLVTLLSQGLKNKEIAMNLGVSENTIKVYLSRLFVKVGVKDRFELALYGLRNVAAGDGRLDEPGTNPVVGLSSLVLDGLR